MLGFDRPIVCTDLGRGQDLAAVFLLELSENALLFISNSPAAGGAAELIGIHIVISQRKCADIVVLIIVVVLFCNNAVGLFFQESLSTIGAVIFLKTMPTGME